MPAQQQQQQQQDDSPALRFERQHQSSTSSSSASAKPPSSPTGINSDNSSVAKMQATIQSSTNLLSSLALDSREGACCNPFRLPNHSINKALRNVPVLIRERFSHVNFEGKRICCACRMRIYAMLKKRQNLKSSVRRGLGAQTTTEAGVTSAMAARRKQEQQQQQRQLRKSDRITMTTTTSQRRGAGRPSMRPDMESRALARESRDKPAPVPTTARDAVEQMAAIAPDHSSSNLVDNLNRLSETTMARRSKSQLTLPANLCPSKQICCFCGVSEDNELEFGKFYHHNGIVTHYYCLLLSSNMEQKGSDDQGILGFLDEDIQKEIRRGKRLICSHCKRNGATLGCCNAKCKRIFHLPCGLKAGSLHQFFGEFRSYCINHRPRQKIDERVKREVEKMSNTLCYICYEEVKSLDSNGTLWAPCCKKNAWFHRSCVQQLAMSAGYFFKCPLCNNKREFQTAMLEYGIYIPRQDASWELVPNAFEELLYRHDRCDSKMCQCPKGRAYTSSNGKWELILCRTCGSQGIHLLCGQLKWSNPTWDCPECMAILRKSNEISNDESTSNSNETERENAFNYMDTNEDSDSDISVGNDSMPVESSLSNIPKNLPEVKLRPGPKSFKLKQVQQLQENTDTVNSSDSNVTSNSNSSNSVDNTVPKKSAEVICLDSDDEAPEIVCMTTMKKTSKLGKQITSLNNFNGSSSSNPFNTSNTDFTTNFELSPFNLSSLSPLITPLKSSTEESSPFNIVISNVTSVPAEFFASVPEESNEKMEPTETLPTSILTPINQQTLSLKRPHSHGDSPMELNKRSCFDLNGIEENHDPTAVPSSSISILSAVEVDRLDNSLPNDMFASSSSNNTTSAAITSNGASLENCHGDAGSIPAVYDIRSVKVCATAPAYVAAAADDKPTLSFGIATSDPEAAVAAGCLPKPMSAVFKHPTANSNGDSCSSRSSKSGNSSINRTRLIPDFVRLSDLKFKVFGENIEISFGGCKIQIKKNNVPYNLDDRSKNVRSDSNQISSVSALESHYMSSDKSTSKPNSSRFDDSGTESTSCLRNLRNRSFKNFIYEDDNTLLEYPTSNPDHFAGSRLLKKPNKQDRNDLKENWNPEVSSSSQNDAINNLNNSKNNNPTSSSDLQGIFNSIEKSTKDDSSGSLVKKEESDPNQRLLRRSGRTVRHFRSVKSSNSVSNGDSDSQTIEKLDQTNDQPIRNTRSQKIFKDLDLPKMNKHLKNVDMNDLRFDLTGKVNVKRDGTEIDADKDFKVSIDLQKIKNFINAEPDLFFKKMHDGVNGRLRVYSMDVKLRVELSTGEKKYLTKAQSFDCLLDVTTNHDFQLKRVRCKSLSDLSQIAIMNNLKSIDKQVSIIDKQVRRSQRRKSKRFENQEGVR